MADKTIAHAERIAKDSSAIPPVTYNIVDQALQNIIRAASFLSARFFNDAAIGSVVPIPQFDVLKALDQPWVSTENLPALHRHWDELSDTMDKWINDGEEKFLPPKPIPHKD